MMRRRVTSIKGTTRTFYEDFYDADKEGLTVDARVARVRVYNCSNDTEYRYLMPAREADHLFDGSNRVDFPERVYHLEGYFTIDSTEDVEYKDEWYTKIHIQ